jgi:hypothetical protein
MHDSKIEDRLRSVLRAEGDGLALTITAPELERRDAERRRRAGGRRVSLIAAGVAGVVVGSLVAFGSGLLALPPGASVPSATTTAPTSSPSPEPSGEATPVGRSAVPLGGPHDAVVVRTIVDGPSDVRRIEVQLWPNEGDASVIATFSGILGANPSPDAPSRVSADGFLAVPLVDWKAPERPAGVAIYDLLSPARDPQILTDLGTSGLAWSSDGRLALFDPPVVTVVQPYGAERTTLRIPAGVVIAITAMQDRIWARGGKGFMAWRQDGISRTPGVLRLDGTFSPDPLLAIDDPIGTERIFDPDGRQLLVGCDAVGDAGGGGCVLRAEAPDGTSEVLYRDVTGDGQIADQRWDALGQGAWLLLDRRAAGGKTTDIVLRHVGPTTQEDVATLSTVTVAVGAFDPRIVGIAGDDGRFAIQLTPSLVVFVDPRSNKWVHSTDTFAGWADQRGSSG